MRIDARRVPALLGLLFLLAFCVTTAVGTLADALPAPVGVAACFAGDTVKLADRRIVRLAAITTPKPAHGSAREQFYAKEALRELDSLTRGHKVRFMPIGVKTRDRHGRIAGDLIRDDGQSLSELMVRRGAAIYSPDKNLLPQLQKRLQTLQCEAISEQAGFWKKLLESPLSARNYVGDKDSQRFFLADSPQAFNIKPRNRIYFGTVMDAFMAGFAPHATYPFWPDAVSMR
ncbi:MAG: thermonuclease family protein [Desulfovibrionaceae bacterium]|nr:thermonuclease family protein [Desulfovibrionaceae bacterium]